MWQKIMVLDKLDWGQFIALGMAQSSPFWLSLSTEFVCSWFVFRIKVRFFPSVYDTTMIKHESCSFLGEILMVSGIDESSVRAIIHSGIGQASILYVLVSKDDRVGSFSTTFHSLVWKPPPKCVASFNGLFWWNPCFCFTRRYFVILDSRFRLYFMAWSRH